MMRALLCMTLLTLHASCFTAMAQDTDTTRVEQLGEVVVKAVRGQRNARQHLHMDAYRRYLYHFVQRRRIQCDRKRLYAVCKRRCPDGNQMRLRNLRVLHCEKGRTETGHTEKEALTASSGFGKSK